jgi:hypothetical protein
LDPGSSDCPWDYNSPLIYLSSGQVNGHNLHVFIMNRVESDNLTGIAKYGEYWVKWRYSFNSNGQFIGEYHLADTYEEMISSDWQL